MFTVTKSEINRLAQEKGININSLEKTLRLIDVLDQLSKHPFLKKCFVLKGGTALNVFYFDLPRLSVDADLNYIKEVDRMDMIAGRKEIDQLIPQIFKNEYSVKFSKKEYALSQFGLHFSTLSGSTDRIKLEINYLHRLPILSITNIEAKHFNVNIKYFVLEKIELFASKIMALLSRYTPRDLFDVYLLVKSDKKIDLIKLRQMIIYYGLISRESIYDLFNLDLNIISESDIRKHLLPMLIGNQYPKLDYMKQIVNDFLKPLLVLSQNEINYIDTFYSTGELQAKALFSDNSISAKVLLSPAFLWKKENIKKHIR